MPGYAINNSCIKGIKPLYYAHKDSKNTHLKGMNEFFEAKSEAYVPERGDETTEEYLAR